MRFLVSEVPLYKRLGSSGVVRTFMIATCRGSWVRVLGIGYRVSDFDSVLLGGGRFLMSEVPLYKRLGRSGVVRTFMIATCLAVLVSGFGLRVEG